MSISTYATPVSQSERITILDSIRGIAILGILLMNIISFALPYPVSFDPTILHETGINSSIAYSILWFFDGTQRALFSMLFGAGIILFVGRQENRSEGLAPADYFFRRQLWLMVFSLIDVYILLWNGDILLEYACFGMMLFTFRKLPPKTLFIMAGVCLLLMLARENRDFYQDKKMIERGDAVAAIDTTKTKLTSPQKKYLEERNAFLKRNTKEGKIKRMKEELEQMQGDYESVYKKRTDHYVNNLVHYLYLQAWDVFICFLLGMAFFKTGILTGNASTKIYTWMTLVGMGIGLSLSYLRVKSYFDYQVNWYEYTKHVSVQFYQLDRIARSIGVLGLIMLMYKSNLFNWFFHALKPVGQMALTNYLMQSLICCVLFSGFAFGLFGKLQRYEVYLVVVAIWTFQLIFCNIWMRFFIYGPVEWTWRSLTYWKRQPLVKVRD